MLLVTRPWAGSKGLMATFADVSLALPISIELEPARLQVRLVCNGIVLGERPQNECVNDVPQR
jgi:hypothetical protein